MYMETRKQQQFIDQSRKPGLTPLEYKYILLLYTYLKMVSEAPINSLLIFYMSTLKRSDLFLATLCASKLATWRRKEGVDAYTGPIQKEGKVYLQRKTGNKVEMDIEVDPLYRRPKSIQTKLSDGHIEQKLSYQYDKKGNITKVTDHFHEDRNQEFEYDAVNRITKAKGKYGEETYTYHKNGNLLKRGQFNLQYNNPNHIHALSRADSPQTGLVNYQYDSIGNLIQRNGDQYSYNAMGKLKEITTEGGDIFTYTYDHSGNRIKKHLKNANTTTYSFGDLYEIHRAPGEPEKHTMYITGLQGDKVSQYSRPENPCPSSSVRWPNRVCQKPAVSGTPYTFSYLIDLIYHKEIFFLYLEILKNFFDTILHLYPQPRSETTSSLTAPHGRGASGFCPRMDNSRQERVGRTYGEILRTDSYGPDISKYKYTGQEEDKESGLYYYKARYYDPVIGRFAQADSMAFPDRIQGMNRMMYVEGNPMSFTDGTGHMLSNSWAAAAVMYIMIKDSDSTDLEKFLFVASAYAKGRAKDRRKSNNFLDRSLNTGRFFQGIQRNSSLGRGLTHNWNLYRKSDIWKVYDKIGENWKKAIKDPRGYVEQSDLARSDIGRSLTSSWKGHLRSLRSLGDQYIHYLKYPKHAIESSDLARSDLGRLVTRNRQALITMYDASGIANISTGGIIWKDILGIPILGKILGVVGVITAYYEVCFKQQACIMGGN
jgi:RHS repeat-associated protein